MNLRNLAESDLGVILEDGVYGFGWPIVLRDPQGFASPCLRGYSNDIAQTIDPDTGELIAGRIATAVLRTSTLHAAGMSLPRGIADGGSKPWLVEFEDINGTPHTFKVRESMPDRALGVVVCVLEGYV